MNPHPLSGLSSDEINVARDVVVASHPDTIIYFREIYLSEPPKAQLREFLVLEHSGRLSPTTPRPSRLALCQYDVVGQDKTGQYHESIVDVRLRGQIKHQIVDKTSHAALTVDEFVVFVEVCNASPLYKQALADFDLPESFGVVIEPWPYGGLDSSDENLC